MDSDEWLTLFLLAVHNSSITLLLRFARTQPSESFDPSLLVIIVEAVKLVCALILEMITSYWSQLVSMSAVTAISKSPQLSNKVFGSISWTDRLVHLFKYLFSELTDRSNWPFLVIPAAAYALQNNMFFVAMGRLSAVEYQIGMQLRIIWTALAASFILGRKLTNRQWLMLLQLAVGIALVEVADWKHHQVPRQFVKKSSTLIGWLAMFVATAAAGCSGVVLEWLNETRAKKPTIWVQAAQLSAFTLCFSTLYYWIGAAASGGGTLIDSTAPVIYANKMTWLTGAIITGQSVGGLLVAYVITNIGNIERCFASSMAIVLSFICERIAFPVHTGSSFFFGTSLWMDFLVMTGISLSVHAIWCFYSTSGHSQKEVTARKYMSLNEELV